MEGESEKKPKLGNKHIQKTNMLAGVEKATMMKATNVLIG
jgi:hypothetical protein